MHLDPRLWKLTQQVRLTMLVAILLGEGAGILAIGQAGALSRVIHQVFLEQKTLAEVSTPLLILAGILIIRAVFNFFSEMASQASARRVKSSLRGRLLKKIQILGPRYTSREQTGELAQILVEGVESLDPYFSQYLPGLALAILVPISIFLTVLQIDLLSALVFLFSAPIIPLFMVLIGNVSQALTRRNWRTLSRLSAYFLDVIQGLTALKIMGRSKDQIKQVSQASEHFRNTTMSVLRVTFLSAFTLEMAATLSTAVIAVEIGLRLLYGRLGFEQAFFILLLAPEFYHPLRLLGARFHAGIAGVEAAESIFQVLDEAVPAQASRIQNQLPNQTREKPKPFNDQADQTAPAVCFDEVALEYSPGRTALHGVSFQIQTGEKLAIVGPSGAGKSSLAALLLRFIEPDHGRILIDGRSLVEIDPAAWRARVAWVPQKPYLFNDTIEANIRLGRPDASRQELVRAVQMAQAERFIDAFPDGYATVVGERGVRLSAGEAQRIAVARAFLKDAHLVILDEATSHLDLENEALLHKAIQTLMEGRTVLAIAHRLNTIRQADRILVLQDGAVQQLGTHQELLKQDGLYRQLVSGSVWRRHVDPPILDGEDSKAVYFPSSAQCRRNQADDPVGVGFKTSRGSRSVIWRLICLTGGFLGWAVLAVLAGASTVLSGVGLMAASAYIIAAAALQPSIAVLQVAIVAVRFFGIGRGLFRYLERYISHQTTFILLSRLRVSFYQALEPLMPARLMAFRSGDLLERIIGDIQTLENFFVRALAPPLTALLSLLAVFAYISGFSPQLGQVLLIFWLIAGLFAPLIGLWWGAEAGQKLALQRSQLKASAVDFIQGLPELLACNQSERAAADLEVNSTNLLDTRNKEAKGLTFQSTTSSLLAGLGMLAVLVMAIPMVSAEKVEGVYLAVIALVVLASFEAVQPLPLAAQTLASDLQAARRLFEVIDAEPEVADTSQPLAMPDHFHLEVRGLCFGYPGADLVLQRISFDLPPGKRLAVVGPSGAGKSTLANLLLRFWQVQPGKILLSGSDIQNYGQDDVRSNMSFIPQQVYLFNMSLRDNLRIGNPGAGDDEIIRAARQAAVHEFILGLPEGYDTWVGEQGVRLSAGERQRIGIARALLKKAPLLIMDEATANLDTLTEKKVLQSILQHSRECSLILIAHRLVGMEEMDEIIVLEKGKIIERGTHDFLLAAGGHYSRTWELQHSILI